MAVQRTLIGNIKGPKGDKGDTGDTGARGAGATVTIGSVTTTAYGGNANVTNSGTSTDAVFDFVLPQGAPGETVTDMENLTLSSMTEPSAQFPVPSIGDNGKTLFGKITKWFSDMRALVNTKLNTANLVNGFTQTTAGTHALDAVAGKTLNDKLNIYRGVLGGNMSAEIPNAGNSMTLIGSIVLPTTVSVYLVMAYANLNVAADNGLMQMDLGGRIVRGTSSNGGGIINFGTINGGTTTAVRGYVKNVTNATMAVSWAAYPLY